MTSTYSSMTPSETGDSDQEADSSVAGQGRARRGASHETLSTTVTSADEFVWIDSHNRLVEVQHLPWSHEDILRVISQVILASHWSDRGNTDL